MPRTQPDGSCVIGVTIEATCRGCDDRHEKKLGTGQIQVHDTDVDLDLSWFCPECGHFNQRSPLLLNETIDINPEKPSLVLCNGYMEIVSIVFES